MDDVIGSALAESAQELESIRQECYNLESQKLRGFLKASAPHVTERGSDNTNVIDQGKATYAFPDDALAAFFAHLEECRRAGGIQHFMERQGSAAKPYSGIMLDFDIALGAPPPGAVPALGAGAAPVRVPAVLDQKAYRQLCTQVTKALVQDLVLPEAAGGAGREHQFHFFFIVRPEVTPLPAAAGGPPRYKYGFHILLPGVQTTRGYKKYLITRLRKNERVLRILKEMGAVGAPGQPETAAGGDSPLAACLDANSASVPVLFFGSCKRGGKLYALGGAYTVTGEAAELRDGEMAVAPIPEPFLAEHNLCRELALWARPAADEAPPAGGAGGAAYYLGGQAAAPAEPAGPWRRGLVRPLRYECRAALAPQIETLADRLAGGLLAADEFKATEAEVEELCHQDRDAAYLQKMLALLDEDYCAEYGKWRNVIFALCSTSLSYLPLAKWFSQRCPEKWTAGGREALEKLWADAAAGQALRRNDPEYRPLTKRSIIYWASVCSPQRFRELSQTNYQNALATFIYKHGGCLGHAMVAEILHMILHERFAVDAIIPLTGPPRYLWFEFVTAGQSMREGEVWKWRQESKPDEIHLYIQKELVKVATEVLEDLKKKREQANDEETLKRNKDTIKKLGATILKFYDNGFQKGVVEQCQFLFRRRGFLDSLDKQADIFGVGNGVLRLASADRPETVFINTYHEWPVSRFTQVRYERFDPRPAAVAASHWHALLLDAVKKIVPELDMRVWMLLYLSTGLYHGLKDPLMLFWVGSGSNAKTFLIRMWTQVLGNYAAKLPISLLTSEREDPSRPNSAFMQSKGRGGIYFEESDKYEVLKTSRLKEMVNPGEVSARELNSKQEVFENSATPIALSNFGFIVETKDHGTWRRLRHYEAKAKFCPDPDPKNPYEHLADRRFINEYVKDPDCQTAFLGILVHFWEVLQREYGGDIDAVPCPTLHRESEEFRNTQDSLNRFLTELIVVSPPYEGEAPATVALSVVSGRFCDWYNSNIESGGRRYAATEVIKDLENSVLMPYLSTSKNGVRVMVGCRLLRPGEIVEELRPGESYLGSRAKHAGAPPFGPGTPEPADWWNWTMPKKKRPAAGDGAGGVGGGAAAGGAPAAAVAAPAGGGPPPTPPPEVSLREDKLLADGRLRREREQHERAAQETAKQAAMQAVSSRIFGGVGAPVAPGAPIASGDPYSPAGGGGAPGAPYSSAGALTPPRQAGPAAPRYSTSSPDEHLSGFLASYGVA